VSEPAPRLRALPRSEADPAVHGDYDAFLKARGNVPNLFATLARRPALMRAAAALLRETLAAGEVAVRLKELIAIRVSTANGCGY
jgi:alkylhydroperoxidase family enzyme